MRTPATLALAGLVTAALAVACAAKPSEDECKKLGEHYMELAKKDAPPDPDMAKDILAAAEGAKQSMVTDCPSLNTKEQVACAMKAADLDAVDACLGGKKGGEAKAPQ